MEQQASNKVATSLDHRGGGLAAGVAGGWFWEAHADNVC